MQTDPSEGSFFYCPTCYDPTHLAPAIESHPARIAPAIKSRYARIASTINANHSDEKVYHFLAKARHTQSSCIWEQIRTRAHASLGLRGIYAHLATHLGTPSRTYRLCTARKKDS
jgi:hypothetical protein